MTAVVVVLIFVGLPVMVMFGYWVGWRDGFTEGRYLRMPRAHNADSTKGDLNG
jgi:hypothetical protein